MGREARAQRGRTRTAPAAPVPAWLDKDGLHALVPGSEPSEAELDEMTRRYQESIRRSPLWDQMVKQFGKAKAETLLRQCRAKLG